MSPRILGSIVASSVGLTPGLYRIPMGISNDTFSEIFEGPRASGGGVQVDNIYYSTYYYTVWDYYVFVIVESWDMETGERLDSRNATSFTILATDVSYDPQSKNIYGCYYNSNGSGYCLAVGDYTNLISTPVCNLDNPWNACAIDSKGQLYAIDFDGRLLKVDKSTGNYSVVGTSSVIPYYLGSAAFDPTDDTLYWTVMTEDGSSAIYKVNTSNAETTLVNSFSGNQQVCGLIVPPREADENAPAAVEELMLNFDKDNLSGTVAFKAPAINYNGSTGEGELTYTIKANDEIIKCGTTSYAASTVADVSLPADGAYKFAVYVSNNIGDGVKSFTKRYIGADTPSAPNVFISYDEGTFHINWDAVSTSVHGGYVNPEAITYKVVRYPDNAVVENSSSLTSCSDAVATPESLVAYSYGVTAIYKDKSSSEGMSNEITIGVIIPPYSQDFSTQAAFDLFTTYDANGDGETWYWWKSRKRAHVMYNKKLGIDDWLFTPALKLKGGMAYPLSFNTVTSGDYVEKFEIKMGKAPNVDAMTTTLIDMTEIDDAAPHPYSCYLEPLEDGIYYIGFHCNSAPDTDYFDVDDILIGDGMLLHAPEAVSDLSINADEKGDKITAISGVTPTVDYSGDLLTTLNSVQIYRDGELVHTIRFPEAGEKFSWADTPQKAGYYTYTVYAVNAYGRGKPASAKVFVGTNITESPQNLSIIETGNTGNVTIKWEAPKLDKDGNPARLNYVTYSIWEGDNKIADNLSGNSYSFDAYTGTGQKYIQYFMTADSESGSSQKAWTEKIPVGTPYTAPYTESFSGGEAHSIFAVETSYSLDPVLWEFCADETVPNLVSQDGDNGYASFKSEYGGSFSTLASGKIDLSGIANPGLTFYSNPLTNGSLNTNTLDVYINSGNGYQKVRETSMTKLLNDGWNKVTISLAAYKGKTIRIMFVGTNNFNIFTVLDNIVVGEIPDYNLTAYNINAPVSVQPGETFTISALVQNNGSLTCGNFNINLLRDDELVDSKKGFPIAAGTEVTAKFNTSLDILSDEYHEFHFEVDYEDDKDRSDNNSDTFRINVALPIYPTVQNLNATSDGDKIKLTWDTPDLSYEALAAETDDFESYTSWTNSNVGDWTFVDRDGGTIGALQNITLPGINGKQSFWVMDSTLPSLNDSFEAASGNKYLANMYTGKQVDDWAISPRLSGEAQTISMKVRSYHEDFPESFQILYSTDDANPDSFFLISSFNNVPADWTEYTADLPQGARYFAIRCVSDDMFMFFIDDVRFIKAHPCENLELKGYNVYHNKTLLEKSNECKYEHQGFIGENTYVVTALYNKGESRPSSKVSYTLSGISNTLTDEISIETSNGNVIIRGATGYSAYIATIGGVKIWSNDNITENTEHVSISTPGIYIIRVGNHTSKIIL